MLEAINGLQMVACSDQQGRKMILASVCRVLYNRKTLNSGQSANQIIESQAWSISMVIHKIGLTETSVFSLYYSHLCILCMDSVSKSRDITSSQSYGFPIVMYKYESWTIKKAECRRTDAFELWCWRRTIESPLDCKAIKPVNPKGINPKFLGKTDAEAETPILRSPDAKKWLIRKDTDAEKDWRQE